MYSTSDFKKNLKILIGDDPYTIVDFQHVKPGKGNQFTRTKMRNLVTGVNMDRTFKSGEKFGVPDVEFKDMNFMYSDGDYHFMDQKDYNQVQMSADDVSDVSDYLTENMEVKVMFFNGRALGIEIPQHVVMKIAQTDPGFKGNTVSNTTKPATLETGAQIQVPLHIKEGDNIKVDTREGKYVERVST